MHTRAGYDHFSHFLKMDSQNLLRHFFSKHFRIHCGSKMFSNRSKLSIAPTQKRFRMYIWWIQRKPTNRRNFGFQTLITFDLWELWKNRKYVKCIWGDELFDGRNFWTRRIFYGCRIFYMWHTIKSVFSRFFTKYSVQTLDLR